MTKKDLELNRKSEMYYFEGAILVIFKELTLRKPKIMKNTTPQYFGFF